MSDEFGLRGPKLPWACPNDRQLALRAKLKTGWSIKTNQFSTYPKPAPLTEREQQMIVSVVKKAEEMDLYEQQRVGKLVDRLESLKKLANGNGVTECVLCGDTFGLSVFGRSNYKCHDCQKAVCRKCVVEISATVKVGSSKEQLIRLCKVCSENRELIKKSGAWFYKGVPKYILPEKKNHYTNSYEKYAASPRSFQEQKYVSRYINSQTAATTDQEPSSSTNKTQTTDVSATSTSATTSTTATGKIVVTSSSNNSNSSVSSNNRPGGYFWSRNLNRSGGGGSSQQTPTTTEESSSGDECGSNFLRSSTGGTTGSAGLGPNKLYKAQHHHQSNISLSCSPGAATTVSSSSNGSNHNGSNWSGMSMSRGHSPPASRIREHKDNTTPLRTSADTSPGEQQQQHTPRTSLAPEEVVVHHHNNQSEGASGQDTPAAATTATAASGSSSTDRRYGSSLDLSSSSSRQIERLDCSRETVNTDQRNGEGVSTSSTTNNGDNNPKSSTSSSNDCLFQQQQGSSPLGILQITVLYDDSHQALHCSVQFAKEVIPMDINGLSDPYCILKLIPSRYEGTHLRTKTIHKTVNPIFNETLTFYGVTMHDLTWQTLQILVMDDDRWGKDCLGTTQIPLHRLRAQQTRCFTQSLERGRLTEEREWGRGRLLLSLTYLTEKNLLLVGVIQAQDLPALDHNGTSDPFVKVRLLHDTNLGSLSTPSCFSSSSVNRKYRTSVKWRTLNPEFREEFSLKVSIVDLPRLALVISVWDKDLGKNDDYIGGIVLSNGSKGDRLKHWLDMMKLPNTKHFKWHTLSPNTLPSH